MEGLRFHQLGVILRRAKVLAHAAPRVLVAMTAATIMRMTAAVCTTPRPRHALMQIIGPARLFHGDGGKSACWCASIDGPYATQLRTENRPSVCWGEVKRLSVRESEPLTGSNERSYQFEEVKELPA